MTNLNKGPVNTTLYSLCVSKTANKIKLELRNI